MRIAFTDQASADAASVDAPACSTGAAPSMFGTQADPCAPWGGSFLNFGAAIMGSAGQVTVTPSSAVSSGGCEVTAPYRTLFLPVRVLDVQKLPSAYTGLQMFDADGVDATTLKVTGGELKAIANDGGGEQLIGRAPYDPVEMRWWQLRPTATSVVIETSADAASWTVRAVHSYTPGSGELQSDSANFGDVNVCP